MAQDPKPFFTIDTAAILAKLHLAGVQQAKLGKNEAILNTGIIDDQATPNPKNPGKAKFDFSNKIGKYEVGIVKEYKYNPPYSELDNNYINTVTNSQKLTEDKIKEIEKSLKTENDEKIEKNKAILDELKKDAFKQLKTYFTNFVGKENCKDLNVNNIVDIPFKYVKQGDKVEYKNYMITSTIDEKAYKKQQDAAKAKFNKDVKAKKTSDLDVGEIIAYYCFKVGYTAVLETK